MKRMHTLHPTLSYAPPLVLQALVSLQRQLEQQLSSAGLHPSSFHAQALQGIFLKALVPLIDLKTLLTDASSSAAKPGEAAAAVKVLRLFHLPASYDASILPEGRNVLSGFSGDEQTGNTGGAAAADPTMDVPAAAAESAFSTAESAPAAPVHLPIEKDAVRLQTSGEAMFTGDVAAHMGGRMLYLAGGPPTCATQSLLRDPDILLHLHLCFLLITPASSTQRMTGALSLRAQGMGSTSNAAAT